MIQVNLNKCKDTSNNVQLLSIGDFFPALYLDAGRLHLTTFDLVYL